MLCRFTFGNFRSFRDETTLDMRTSGQWTPFKPSDVEGFGIRLLPAAVIYGPNAGGKTNIVLAANTLQSIILSGLSGTPLPLQIMPFVHECNQARPIFFEIDFIAKQRRYQYRIEIALSDPFMPTCEYTIVNERLDCYKTPKGTYNLFTRSADGVRISREQIALDLLEKKDDPSLENLEQSASDNLDKERLFLTGGFQTSFCKTIATEVVDYFKQDFFAVVDRKTASGELGLLLDSPPIAAYMVDEEDPDGERRASIPLLDHIMKFSDIGPQHIFMHVGRDAKSGKQKNRLAVEYAVGNKDRKITTPVHWMESNGTLRMIHFSPLLYHVLERGSTLIVDELDASIHPEMIASLIAAFNDPGLNPKHAQLIFTSHNTVYLEKKMLRRDQILFVQKKENYSSELYSLADFGSKTVRGDGSLLKQYLKGNFGALPLGSFSMALRKLRDEQMEVSNAS